MRNIQSMACKVDQLHPILSPSGEGNGQNTSLVKKKPYKIAGSRNDL